MKKLTFYFLVSLFFITNVLADQLAVVDIKLGTKLTDYFSTAQISKYNINDVETNTPFYSYEGKYSMFEIIKKEKFIEKFLSHFTGNINASKFLNLQGLISIWIPNI